MNMIYPVSIKGSDQVLLLKKYIYIEELNYISFTNILKFLHCLSFDQHFEIIETDLHVLMFKFF